MTCEHFEKLVALEIAGDLSAGEAARAQEHLKECASCGTLADDLAADLLWLRSVHEEPPDRAALHQVRVGVMRQLESERSGGNHPFGGLAAWGWRWQWVAALGAVMLLAGAFWSSRAPKPAVVAVPAQELPKLRASTPYMVPNDGHAEETAQSVPQTSEGAPARAHRTRTASGKHGEAPTAPQRAHVEDAPVMPAEAQGPGPLFDESGQVEIVTALLEDPESPSVEAVLLKIPTANPDIVIYWLMDDAERMERDEENQGD